LSLSRVDGNFTSQGKLGAAIIGNHSESSVSFQNTNLVYVETWSYGGLNISFMQFSKSTIYRRIWPE